jgi:deoxyadenosine/deoxycytidine kinase
MVLKAVELIRQIRDKHYQETKNFSVEEQIFFIKEKAEKFRKLAESDRYPQRKKKKSALNISSHS